MFYDAPLLLHGVHGCILSSFVCFKGTWEEAAGNDGSGWSRIYEGGRVAMANGGKARLDGTNGGWVSF